MWYRPLARAIDLSQAASHTTSSQSYRSHQPASCVVKHRSSSSYTYASTQTISCISSWIHSLVRSSALAVPSVAKNGCQPLLSGGHVGAFACCVRSDLVFANLAHSEVPVTTKTTSARTTASTTVPEPARVRTQSARWRWWIMQQCRAPACRSACVCAHLTAAAGLYVPWRELRWTSTTTTVLCKPTPQRAPPWHLALQQSVKSSSTDKTATYSDFGCANTSADTEAAGYMAKLSVSLIPVLASTSSSSHMMGFSVWSGCDGYPGAGRIPWYLILCMADASSP